MPIPGCENYNANYFSQRKMSIKCENIDEIITNTKKLLKDKKLQEELSYNQKKYIKNDTAEKIVELIIKGTNK